MALNRKYQKIFGVNATETDLGVVGSKNAGNPQYSVDVETLQSLSNWETGMRALVTSTLAPYLQDQNSIFYVITSQLAYLFQAGIAEWNSQTEYVANRSVVFKNGKIYVATANSLNIEPEVTANWGASWKLYQYTLLLGNFFDNTFVAAGGSYPQDAIINYTDSYGNTIQIKSLINNNTDAPSSSNIKTPTNPSGSKWEIVSNKTTEMFLINPNATSNYIRLGEGGSGYLNIENSNGIYFSDKSMGINVGSGQMNIFGAGLQVNSNPVMRIPDYSTKTQVAASDDNTTRSWTATFDGWVEAEVYIEYGVPNSNDAVFSINGKSIYTRDCDQNRYGVLGLYPIKTGDVINVRRGIRAFSYSYR